MATLNKDFIYVKDRRAIKGDIVIFINEEYFGSSFTYGKLYRVNRDHFPDETLQVEEDNDGDVNGMSHSSFKIIKTLRCGHIKKGDTITPIDYSSSGRTRGRIYECISINSADKVKYGATVSAHRRNWLMLCTVNHANNKHATGWPNVSAQKSEWEL